MIRSTCPNELNNSIELMRYTFSWEVLLCSKISAQTRTQIRYDLAHEPDTCSLSLTLTLYLLFDLGVPASSLTSVHGFCLFMGMFSIGFGFVSYQFDADLWHQFGSSTVKVFLQMIMRFTLDIL